MSKDKEKTAANKNSDWKDRSKTSMKAIQEAFQLSGNIPDVIRAEAYREGLSASDMCRKILQLPIEEKKTGGRRLTISLKPSDYEELAERWGLPVDARHAIRTRIRQDLESFYYQHENETQD